MPFCAIGTTGKPATGGTVAAHKSQRVGVSFRAQRCFEARAFRILDARVSGQCSLLRAARIGDPLLGCKPADIIRVKCQVACVASQQLRVSKSLAGSSEVTPAMEIVRSTNRSSDCGEKSLEYEEALRAPQEHPQSQRL